MLVCENVDQYLPLWERGKMVKFNIVTCFFGVTWMIYRKMYIEAILFTLLTYIIMIPFAFAAVIFSQLLNMDLAFVPVVTAYLFTWIGIGFFGKYIYAKHITRKLNKILEKHGDEPNISKILVKKGGTAHPLIIFAYIILNAVINIVLS